MKLLATYPPLLGELKNKVSLRLQQTEDMLALLPRDLQIGSLIFISLQLQQVTEDGKNGLHSHV